jgi:hypothetical protein
MYLRYKVKCNYGQGEHILLYIYSYNKIIFSTANLTDYLEFLRNMGYSNSITAYHEDYEDNAPEIITISINENDNIEKSHSQQEQVSDNITLLSLR